MSNQIGTLPRAGHAASRENIVMHHFVGWITLWYCPASRASQLSGHAPSGLKGNLGGHPGIRQSRGQEQHDPSRDAAPIPIRMRRRTTRESARAGCIHPRLSP
jgi:hypothetical protein